MSNIIRVLKNKNYTVINNKFLEDKRLSWKAKGLLAYLLSRPDDWKIYMESLGTISKDKYTSTRNAFRELKKYGYATEKKYTIAGRFLYQRTIREEPLKVFHTGKSTMENHQLLSTNILSTKLLSTKLLSTNIDKGLKKIKQLKNNFKIKSF